MNPGEKQGHNPEGAEKRPEEETMPLLLDELARVEDLPASVEMPPDVSASLTNPTLYVSSKERGFDPSRTFTRVEDTEGAWRLQLTASSRVGLPGRTAERMERHEDQLPPQSHPEPFQPPWLARAYQPKITSEFPQRRPLRRINGKLVEQYSGVYPPDLRQVFYPQAYPWGCVGKLFVYDRRRPDWVNQGSGVLIGPQHVLTAGHMIPWGSNDWSMLFVPGYYDGLSVFGEGTYSWVSDSRAWNTGTAVAAHDIAVLRLFTPLGSMLGWMSVRTFSQSWLGVPSWTLAGYPVGIAGGIRPCYQSGIAVLDVDSDTGALELEHHGSATPGESGGPFFGIWADGVYTIGTLSGGQTTFGIGGEDNNIAAGGRAMVDLVVWALANWL